jgi:hypothetical protein
MPVRRLLPLASLLLLAACSQCSATTAPPQHAGEAAPPAVAPPSRLATPGTITAVDGLPAALAAEHPLWEVVHGPYLEHGPEATRLYPEGSWYSYLPRRRSIVDGWPTLVDAPAAWRFEGQVETSALAAIEQQLRERIELGHFPAGAGATAGEIPDDHSVVTSRIWLDGQEHVSIRVTNNREASTPLMSITGTLFEGTIRSTVPIEQP